MNREVMRYKLNEVRMMINDGEHGEEQGILVECIKALESAEGEYIRKSDMERILYSTNNAIRIGEEFLELPTYSFPEREKGEWIEKRNKATGHIESVCSVCGAEESYPYNLFCPNCGADMRGDKA